MILRGHRPGETEADDLYYRVMLIDAQGEQLLIRRNHHYILHIEGELSYGQRSFGEALDAAVTNNVWISIRDNIDEVSDGTFTLKVDRTSYVLDQSNEGRQYSLRYTLRRNDGSAVSEADKPSVTWLDGNNVAGQNVGNSFVVGSDGVGNGELTVVLREMGGSEKLEGTLLVKRAFAAQDQDHPHQNAVVPARMGGVAGVRYALCRRERRHVRRTCDVDVHRSGDMSGGAVSAAGADRRRGSRCPRGGRHVAAGDPPRRGWLRREYPRRKGEPIECHKFVYTAVQPGVQRVYFRTILPQSGSGAKTKVSVEAGYFATQEKEVTYTGLRYVIEVAGLNEYTARPDDDFADDEKIFLPAGAAEEGRFRPVHHASAR